jgi:hypothetical protein
MNERRNYHFSIAAIKLLMHQQEPVVPLKKNTNTSEHETGGREGHRLRVFENRVLREMCGCKWEGITGDCTE